MPLPFLRLLQSHSDDHINTDKVLPIDGRLLSMLNTINGHTTNGNWSRNPQTAPADAIRGLLQACRSLATYEM